jgi:hypothetical protein
MKGNRKTYSAFQLVSSCFLILTLLWLTISIPFVSANQQELAKQHKVENCKSPVSNNEEEVANPFGNNTEEKAPFGNSFAEEYLHADHCIDYFFITIPRDYACEDVGTYIAYHGELLVPPPNAA